MEFSPGLFTWPTISPRPTIIILVLAIRSLAKTTDVVNDRNDRFIYPSKTEIDPLKNVPLPLPLLLSKRLQLFLFSFFLSFFSAHVFTEARKSEISESNCREFYTRSAVLEILPTPAGYSLFRWSIRVVSSVLFPPPLPSLPFFSFSFFFFFIRG